MNNSYTSAPGRGFTLIELLVVVLIIGILSAVALPQYTKAVEKARLSEALSNIKTMQDNIDLYLLENGGFPSGSVKYKDLANATELSGGSFDNDDFTSYNREAIAERINSIKLEIEELNKLQSGYEAAAEEFENLVGKKFSTEIEITGTNPFSDFVSGQISSASKLYADGMQTVASVQEAATAALIDGWKQLEHKYATGVIATEAELWSQKSALLEQYGNADLEDHWKY